LVPWTGENGAGAVLVEVAGGVGVDVGGAVAGGVVVGVGIVGVVVGVAAEIVVVASAVVVRGEVFGRPVHGGDGSGIAGTVGGEVPCEVER